MTIEQKSHKIFSRQVGGDGCELRVICETAPAEDQGYERIVGGDGCELTIVCPPDENAAAAERKRACAYPDNESLPENIREQLPAVVQTLYREAYNRAWASHIMPLRRGLAASHDEAAKRAAWAAVRRLYTQIDTTWVRRRGQ